MLNLAGWVLHDGVCTGREGIRKTLVLFGVVFVVVVFYFNGRIVLSIVTAEL